MGDGEAGKSVEFHKGCNTAKVGASTRFSASAETKEMPKNASQNESIAIVRLIDIDDR